jgi:lambda family phage portal protein
MAEVVNYGDEDVIRASSMNLGPGYGWSYRPSLQSSDIQTWRNKDAFASDARDAARTNPYGKSAVRSQVDAIIGTEFKLQYEPDYDALGVSAEEAAAYADLVEGEWNRSATSSLYHMDAQRKQTFTGLMRTAYASFYVSGEVLATVEWKKAFNGDRTCLHILEPERLSDPRGMQDRTGHRRMGVERDKHGAPVAYHIREANMSDVIVWGPSASQFAWRRVPRYTPWGRLNVIHFFDQDRPDMTRGITSFTTALLPMRLLQDYNTTELESAAIRATYAAVVESELDYEQAMRVIGDANAGAIGNNKVLDFTLRMMADRASFYRGQDFKFGKSKVAHLLPNEKLHMVQGNQSASALKDFNAQNLYMLASALGVDHATLTKNFSDTNYSGARAALFDVWRSYEVRRSSFIDGVAVPFFGAWLEERIAFRGTLPMLGNKSFFEARDAICRATFQTWNKPRLDPLKENEADKVLYEMGALSLRDLCAVDGKDWRKVLQQRALEKAERERLGLLPEDINPAVAAAKVKGGATMPRGEDAGQEGGGTGTSA